MWLSPHLAAPEARNKFDFGRQHMEWGSWSGEAPRAAAGPPSIGEVLIVAVVVLNPSYNRD